MIEAVPGRLDGAPSQLRRRWSEEIKEQAIAESLVPGANVSAIARRIGIGPSQLFDWRRKALRKGSVVVTPAPDVDLEDKKTASPVMYPSGGSRLVFQELRATIVWRLV